MATRSWSSMAGWRGEAQIADYERVVVAAHDRGEVAIGTGRGVLLGHEADESPLGVSRSVTASYWN